MARASARPAARALALALATVAFVGPLVVGLPAFVESHRLATSLDRAIAPMATGEAVIAQRLDARDPTDLFRAESCGWALAERGGRCAGDFTSTSIAPARMSEHLLWTELERGSANGGAVELRLDRHLRAYRYLLLCCAAEGDRASLAQTLSPFARLAGHDGGWLLFESTLHRIAPNAPESALVGR